MVFFIIAALAFVAAYNYQHHPVIPDQGQDQEEQTVPPVPSVPASPVPNSKSGKRIPNRVGTDEPQHKPGSTSANPDAMTREQFLALAQKALNTLPRQDETQALTDEQAHFLPETVLKKSEILVQINQAVDKNPQLADDAFVFYDRCAKKNELVKSIRARCLTRLKMLAITTGKDLDMGSYPDDVQSLSNFMPQ